MFTAEITENDDTVGVAGISADPNTVRVNTGASSDELEVNIVPAEASNEVVR